LLRAITISLTQGSESTPARKEAEAGDRRKAIISGAA